MPSHGKSGETARAIALFRSAVSKHVAHPYSPATTSKPASGTPNNHFPGRRLPTAGRQTKVSSDTSKPSTKKLVGNHRVSNNRVTRAKTTVATTQYSTLAGRLITASDLAVTQETEQQFYDSH